jgi:hypothetical protein
MINYLILSTLGTLLFFAIYKLLLEKEKHLKFNRYYLVLSLIVALGLPALDFDIPIQLDEESQLAQQTHTFFKTENQSRPK